RRAARAPRRTAQSRDRPGPARDRPLIAGLFRSRSGTSVPMNREMEQGSPTPWLDRLGGLAVPEEKRLAGRVAGALYLVGAVTALTLLTLPHVERTHPVLVATVALLGAVWGI